MSFFTSFCDFPQKEQHSVWFSRLSTNAPPSKLRRASAKPPPSVMLRLSALNLTLLHPGGRFLDDHFVDQTVFLGFARAHEVVAIGVFLDPIERLPGVLLHDFVQLRLQAQDLLGVQLDVARLAAEAP